jgi:hypothetical protein
MDTIYKQLNEVDKKILTSAFGCGLWLIGSRTPRLKIGHSAFLHSEVMLYVLSSP